MTTPAEFRRRFLQTDTEQTADFQKAIDAHRAKADQVREQTNAQLQRIAGRKDLTPEAKRGAAARTYKPACEQIQQMLNDHIAMVEGRKQALAQKAFGSDNTTDPTTAMMRRQARQQAAGIQDRQAAEEMLREAQFEGDTHLARAVARASFDNGWHSVVDQWNADGSNNAYMRHVVELMQMPDTNDPVWRINTAASYVKPDAGPDLLGLRDHEISRAAESGPEVAA